jgi:hypothetical protein
MASGYRGWHNRHVNQSRPDVPMRSPMTADFWPPSLAHLARPYLGDTDEEVVIAEVSSTLVEGYPGHRLLFTLLVPFADLHAVLTTPGGIGTEVECWGPHPCVPPEGGYQPHFWIEGHGRKYDTLINAWLNHNKFVILPDNGLLMCYGLVPRILAGGSIAWDDPRKPVYDVVRVTPLSHYTVDEYTTARITVRREYLEDYLSLAGCAAVITYFEERYSTDDPVVTRALGGQRAITADLPGRKLTLMRVDGSRGDQLSQVWGTAHALTPVARPISDEQELILTWPGHQKPLTERDVRVLAVIDHAFIRDEVLHAYEDRPEFEINPESGSISYGSWWGVSWCHRTGRNHIRLELRKLYEGTPSYVIKHFNRFAVSEADAEKDRQTSGSANIGTRARDVITAYLHLTMMLTDLAERLGLGLPQEEIGGFETERVKYVGWWTIPELRRLGDVALPTMGRSEFLARCKTLFSLFARLQRTPLRQMLTALGMSKGDLADFGSIKLLATISQLATIAAEEGYELIGEAEAVLSRWNGGLKVQVMAPLFALNALRNRDAHPGAALTAREIQALGELGVDPHMQQHGWGESLDKVYDAIISAVWDIAAILRR